MPDDAFKALIDSCSVNGKIEIVKNPSGTDQNDTDNYFFKRVFVHQWTRGMEGDSFSGYIYGQISKNKWLKVPYEC